LIAPYLNFRLTSTGFRRPVVTVVTLCSHHVQSMIGALHIYEKSEFYSLTYDRRQ
jgi:hypothetical protein